MSERKMQLQFFVEAGIFVRKSLIKRVILSAFCHKIQIKTEEARGFIDSVFRITLEGKESAVRAAFLEMKTFIDIDEEELTEFYESAEASQKQMIM